MDATLPGALGLSRRQRWTVLVAAFLGWMFAGLEMSVLPMATRSVTLDLIARPVAADGEALADVSVDGKSIDEHVGKWFVRYIVSFLLGAALGGLVFGWLGDHWGRKTAMGVSILWYSGFTGMSYFAQSPLQLIVLRFVACMGIGGMWPSGVALVSEAWSDVARPTLAGLIGMSANVGKVLLGQIVHNVELTPDSWRWMFLVGLAPALLGVWVLLFVPESPLWLAQQGRGRESKKGAPVKEVFRPPMLWLTIAGIALGTIPLLGAWGAQKWIIPWADKVGGVAHPDLKGLTQTVWASGAAIGSLCGGWLASMLGRRRSYFLVSLASLVVSGLIFRFLEPAEDARFLVPVFFLGLVATVYFGWLPLFLPELFPTRVRATGSGVAFNFGRIVAAVVLLSTVGLVQRFNGDYARVGQTMSLVFAFGMIVILFVPRTSETIDAD